MRRFERQADGSFEATLDEAEVGLLSTLTQQSAAVVSGADLDDPAVRRVLPDAYPNDPEASAEFRRFTQADLAGRKTANAERMLATLEETSDGRLRLDAAAAQAWLRGLTDIRLILAARLGIETEEDTESEALDPVMRDIYDWLGFVQNSLVEALDA
jgi:hypothetical protein